MPRLVMVKNVVEKRESMLVLSDVVETFAPGTSTLRYYGNEALGMECVLYIFISQITAYDRPNLCRSCGNVFSNDQVMNKEFI